jgi:WS/DGAT/MGAT family acyltransferase
MSYMDPLAAFFVATETQRSPWHAMGCEIFELPRGDGARFIASLMRELHEEAPVFPFDSAVDGGRLWPRWRPVDVDMDYHLRHQVLPSPGGDRELMQALGHFYSGLLDRNAPLWECCIFEGLSDGRFAIAYKLHHSLMDGQGGMEVFLNALNTRKADRRARALWSDNSDNSVIPARAATHASGNRGKAARNAVNQLLGLPRQLLQPSRLRELRDLQLFRAPRTPMNHPQESSARRFGYCDLSLPEIKAIARREKVTVNDLLLYGIDTAVRRYLREQAITLKDPLVCGMPVSTRTKTSGEGGNQAGLLAVELGHAKATPTARLQQIHASTERAKNNVRALPNGLIAGYGAVVLGMPLLLSQVPGLAESLPIVNMGISNISPPRGSNYLGKKLYRKGARLLGLYTQPILPPAVLLNVTITSIDHQLCLGIGSTREAIGDPTQLGEYIIEAISLLTETSDQDK